MTARLRQLLSAALTALTVSACAASHTLTADPGDYALYRRTRTAETAEARLTASAEYLEKMPEGRWRAEVKRWFERAEPRYFAWAERSTPRLERYLGVLPRGPHASAARERIAELDLGARIKRQRDESVLEEALAVEGKLADAAAMRRALVTAVTDWTRRLSTIESWGQPTSELDHELLFRYRMQEPAARCADERCSKLLELPFAIPDGGKLRARKALMEIELGLYRGTVVRARLAGPELWSRLSEASELRPVRPDDAQARAEAIARSVQIVEGALPASLGRVECRREPVSPVVLLAECGVRVTMRAGTTAELDDELVIEPIGGNP